MAATMSGTARAGTLSATGIFSQFNAVIFGNFSTTSDVEGRTAVGGNLTGGATFDLNPAGAASSAFSALSVYRNATSGRSYNVNRAGGVTIAGTNNVSFNLNGGGSAYVGGTNRGALSLSNGSGSLNVIGANSGTLTLNSGGSVYLGAGTSGGGLNASGSTAVQIQGNNGANLNLNGGATATKVSSLTLTAPTSTLGSFASTFQTQLTALSTHLNGVAPNSNATTSNRSIAFNAAPNSSGVAVFDVNTSLFAPNSTVTINVAGASSIITNVNVDSCVSNNCSFALPNSVNFSNPTGYAATVLWNFVNATNLTFSNEFGGSVLAAVTNNGPIDGTLEAASFSGNGELHSHPYTGTFPGGASAQPAPEPASLALISTGLVGLAALRRRSAGNTRSRGLTRSGRFVTRL